MAALKNIVFDLGNVIVTIQSQRSYEALKSLIGVNYNLFAEKLDKVFYDYETGMISEEEWTIALQGLKTNSVTKEQIVKAWNAMLIDIPLARLRMMKELSKSYSIYILSNTNYTHIAWIESFLQKTHGSPDWESWGVTKAFYSHTLYARKPEEEIYLQLINQSRINPAETLLIDDLHTNIEMAINCGWQAQLHNAEDEITHQINSYLSKHTP